MPYRRIIWQAMLTLPALLHSQDRPAITGIAQVALRTNDPAGVSRFYGHDLGLPRISKNDQPGPDFFQVNPHQYIQMSPDLKNEAEDRLGVHRLRNKRRGQIADLPGEARREDFSSRKKAATAP